MFVLFKDKKNIFKITTILMSSNKKVVLKNREFFSLF